MLVKTLNRLGVCSSADTLARFIQHKRNISEHHQFRHMSKDALTIVSADNLDLMHSFTRVFFAAIKKVVGTALLYKFYNLYHHYLCLRATKNLLPETHVSPIPPLMVAMEIHVPLSRSLETHVSPRLPPLMVAMEITCTSALLTGDPRVSWTATPHGGHGDTCTSVSLTRDPRVSQTAAPHGGHGDTCISVSLTGDTPASSKRLERSSPFPSPLILTRSPLAKLPRHLRSGTEGRMLQDVPPHSRSQDFYGGGFFLQQNGLLWVPSFARAENFVWPRLHFVRPRLF